MPLLRDHPWRLRYTPDDGDLVAGLYVPLLACAVRYDRLTGYFSAAALALATRGLEGLVRNDGTMRMIVGCTLGPDEVQAIADGEALRIAVERRLSALPLAPSDDAARRGLALLAWLVAAGRLAVKVAVPCDSRRRPLGGTAIFHEKAGTVEDAAGEKVAFNGSLNETAQGWTQNFESLNIFTSWSEPPRVAAEEEHFARLWADRSAHALVLDVPQAARDDLLRFMPEPATPAARPRSVAAGPVAVEPPAAPSPSADLRGDVWRFIAQAPTMPDGGDQVGAATCAVTPWPHQLRAFHRLYDHWPPRLLIADEVGLGKTIQAGLLLRQAWLARRARRILVLAPAAVLRQWQIELREKFNLNWPIYDGHKLSWYPSPALHGRHERPVARSDWHREPVVIASSHLLRRAERAAEMADAEPWDLVVLDEAHHARRKAAGSEQEGGPNALLKLMRSLQARTAALVLLTATPMQVHPVEVWDLLDLLGLPPEWSKPAFLRFFDEIVAENPGHEAMDRMAAMFRAAEAAYGPVEPSALQALGIASPLRARKMLEALRDPASVPRRQLEHDQRRAALTLMRRHTPIARLVSRNTRDTLRSYFRSGQSTARVAERDVCDEFIHLSAAERTIYDAVESYISTTYQRTAAGGASAQRRNAVGFIMTVYRKRLASSFHALRATLAAHMAAMRDPTQAAGLLSRLSEDVDEDEPDAPDQEAAEDLAREDLARQALAIEERSEIERLIGMIGRLPPDTKAEALRVEIGRLRKDGYGQAMVFTQYADTMDFLRDEMARDRTLQVMCFSGRGGEVRGNDGAWRTVSRDEVKRRFREELADLLLCTDAAAEGLNFQFCGALVNYDSPWNPMRIEQRIGRIDRLGQRFERIRIANLHYANTVEADVYAALRRRIGLFEKVVGGLQPILARMPKLIGARILSGTPGDVAAEVDRAADEAMGGFDLDQAVAVESGEAARAASPMAMADLDDILSRPGLLPPGTRVRSLGAREYGLSAPGQAEVRVSTDVAYYEQHAETVELWSPAGPMFPILQDVGCVPAATQSLAQVMRSIAVKPAG